MADIDYKHVCQRVMQVLGPDVPSDVDYTRRENAAGLISEVQQALQYLRDAGIEYQYRRRRRNAGAPE